MGKIIHAEDKFGPEKFLVGSTYSCKSLCDHNTIWTFKIVSRTEKSVTFVDEDERRHTKKIYINNEGVEYIRPHGNYSMSPVLRAR